MLWNEPPIAAFRSASSKMMFGDLPPSSSVTRLRSRPAFEPISRPTDGGAGEGDLVHAGVIDQRRADCAVAVDDVHDAVGESGFLDQLGEAQGGERSLLGRLEDDGAAGGERRRELPHGHHQREVPGDDLRADADRHALGVDEHVLGLDRDRAALELARPAGEVTQVLDRVADVDDLRDLDRLAVVDRLELRRAPRRSRRSGPRAC